MVAIGGPFSTASVFVAALSAVLLADRRGVDLLRHPAKTDVKPGENSEELEPEIVLPVVDNADLEATLQEHQDTSPFAFVNSIPWSPVLLLSSLQVVLALLCYCCVKGRVEYRFEFSAVHQDGESILRARHQATRNIQARPGLGA